MSMSANKMELAAATEQDPRWGRSSPGPPRRTEPSSTRSDHRRVLPAVVRGSRRARPENVRFHATREDAERAGFRPCKRCRPDQPSLAEQHAAQVTEACRLIEIAPSGCRRLDELARGRPALSPFHFHRVFKAVTGLTPRAYARAHRAQRVRDGARRGARP